MLARQEACLALARVKMGLMRMKPLGSAGPPLLPIATAGTEART